MDGFFQLFLSFFTVSQQFYLLKHKLHYMVQFYLLNHIYMYNVNYMVYSCIAEADVVTPLSMVLKTISTQLGETYQQFKFDI